MGHATSGAAGGNQALAGLVFRPESVISADQGSVEQYSRLVTDIRRSAWDNLLVTKSESSINRFHARLNEICEEAQAIAGDPTKVPVEVENLLNTDDLRILEENETTTLGVDSVRSFGRRWQLSLQFHF